MPLFLHGNTNQLFHRQYGNEREGEGGNKEACGGRRAEGGKDRWSYGETWREKAREAGRGEADRYNGLSVNLLIIHSSI